MNDIPQTIGGKKVEIARPVLAKTETKRAWKERLFTLPFRPLCKLKTVSTLVETVADGQVIQNGQTLLMNAKTWVDFQVLVNTKGNWQMKTS